jgi:DNA-binding winged helix-turn-helix (wHTH) protein
VPTIKLLAERLQERVDDIVRQPALLDDTNVLHRGQKSIALPPGEASALRVLLAHAGVVLSRRTLEHALWPEGAPSGKALDAIIYRLRRQLAGLLIAIDLNRKRGYVLLPRSAGARSAVHVSPTRVCDAPD